MLRLIPCMGSNPADFKGFSQVHKFSKEIHRSPFLPREYRLTFIQFFALGILTKKAAFAPLSSYL